MRFRVMRGNSLSLSGNGGKIGCNVPAVKSYVELTAKQVEVYRDSILARVAERTIRPADDEARELCGV
jgi:hypothetical protein